MKYGLSKSRYCSGVQCPKMLWLRENKPEAYDASCMNQSVPDSGLEVGDPEMTTEKRDYLKRYFT